MTQPATPIYAMTAAEAAECLRRSPRNLAAAQAAASAGYTAARSRLPKLTATIEAVWLECKSRTISAERNGGGPSATPAERSASQAEQYAAADFAASFFSELLNLRPAELATVTPQWDDGGIVITDAARAVLESRPALAWWLRSRDAKEAATGAIRAAERERAQADMPRNLIAALRARGVVVELGKGGALTVPPGTNTGLILASELEALKDLKAEIVALLRHEAELARFASAPLVLVP